MFETCTRCQAPAASLMVFNYRDRAVWLDDIRADFVRGEGYLMCAQHADRLTPPLGWTLTDRRSASRLFAPLEVAS